MVTPLRSRNEEKEVIDAVFLLCARPFRGIVPLTLPIIL